MWRNVQDWRNVHEWNMSFDVDERAIEMETPAPIESNVWKPFKNIQLPDPSYTPAHLSQYYAALGHEISRFESVFRNDERLESREARESRELTTAARYAQVTLVINLILIVTKIGGAIVSNSVTAYVTTVDSGSDIVCGVILLLTNSAMTKRPPGRYPHVRARLEATSLLLFAVVMCLGGVTMLAKALDDVTQHARERQALEPKMGPFSITVLAVTIIAKGTTYSALHNCRLPTVRVLCVDQRNDVVINFLALIGGILGTHVWVYSDPIGGMITALYVLIAWGKEGYEYIHPLAGKAAPSNIQRLIIWSAISHPDDLVQGVTRLDTSSCGERYDVTISLLVSPVQMDTDEIIERIKSRLCLLTEVESVFIGVEYFEEDCENVSRDLTEVDMLDYSRRRSLRYSDENRRVSIDVGELDSFHLATRQVSTVDECEILVEESERL